MLVYVQKEAKEKKSMVYGLCNVRNGDSCTFFTLGNFTPAVAGATVLQLCATLCVFCMWPLKKDFDGFVSVSEQVALNGQNSNYLLPISSMIICTYCVFLFSGNERVNCEQDSGRGVIEFQARALLTYKCQLLFDKHFRVRRFHLTTRQRI